MNKLSSRQVKQLKSKAHHLNPIFQVGKNGVNDNFLEQIDDVLEKRELIKISILTELPYSKYDEHKSECAPSGLEGPGSLSQDSGVPQLL